MTDDTQTWRRLTELLGGADDELRDEVAEALEDPDADRWEALIGALDDAGLIAYLDVDDTGMELADALAQLPVVVRAELDLGEVNDTDDLGEAVALASETLGTLGHTLVRLDDNDDDALPLIAVESAHVGEVARLAADLGRPVVVPGA